MHAFSCGVRYLTGGSDRGSGFLVNGWWTLLLHIHRRLWRNISLANSVQEIGPEELCLDDFIEKTFQTLRTQLVFSHEFVVAHAGGNIGDYGLC